MRFVTTMFLWLVTTVLLAVAVPTMWAQRNVVSEDGYAALAATAAHDPTLQRAMASELSTQITDFAANNGYGNLNTELVHNVVDGLHRQRRISRSVRAGQPNRTSLDVHRLDPVRGRLG